MIRQFFRRLLCRHEAKTPSGPAVRSYRCFSENLTIARIQMVNGIIERRTDYPAVCHHCGASFTAVKVQLAHIHDPART